MDRECGTEELMDSLRSVDGSAALSEGILKCSVRDGSYWLKLAAPTFVKSSPVWKFFDVCEMRRGTTVADSTVEKTLVRCALMSCGNRELAYNPNTNRSTRGMWGHLQAFHPEEHIECVKLMKAASTVVEGDLPAIENHRKKRRLTPDKSTEPSDMSSASRSRISRREVHHAHGSIAESLSALAGSQDAVVWDACRGAGPSAVGEQLDSSRGAVESRVGKRSLGPYEYYRLRSAASDAHVGLFSRSIAGLAPYILPSRKGKSYYYCAICDSHFALHTMGIATVRQHIECTSHRVLLSRFMKDNPQSTLVAGVPPPPDAQRFSPYSLLPTAAGLCSLLPPSCALSDPTSAFAERSVYDACVPHVQPSAFDGTALLSAAAGLPRVSELSGDCAGNAAAGTSSTDQDNFWHWTSTNQDASFGTLSDVRRQTEVCAKADNAVSDQHADSFIKQEDCDALGLFATPQEFVERLLDQQEQREQQRLQTELQQQQTQQDDGAQQKGCQRRERRQQKAQCSEVSIVACCNSSDSECCAASSDAGPYSPGDAKDPKQSSSLEEVDRQSFENRKDGANGIEAEGGSLQLRDTIGASPCEHATESCSDRRDSQSPAVTHEEAVKALELEALRLKCEYRRKKIKYLEMLMRQEEAGFVNSWRQLLRLGVGPLGKADALLANITSSAGERVSGASFSGLPSAGESSREEDAHSNSGIGDAQLADDRRSSSLEAAPPVSPAGGFRAD